MGTLAAIRDGIKVRLATISGLRAYDLWPDTLNSPAAIVKPVSFDYTAMGGAGAPGEYRFEIQLAIQIGTLRTAQDALDAYLALTGDQSIPVALEGDHKLGGAAEDCVIQRWRNYEELEANGVRYLSAIFDVLVLSSG